MRESGSGKGSRSGSDSWKFRVGLGLDLTGCPQGLGSLQVSDGSGPQEKPQCLTGPDLRAVEDDKLRRLLPSHGGKPVKNCCLNPISPQVPTSAGTRVHSLRVDWVRSAGPVTGCQHSSRGRIRCTGPHRARSDPS